MKNTFVGSILSNCYLLLSLQDRLEPWGTSIYHNNQQINHMSGFRNTKPNNDKLSGANAEQNIQSNTISSSDSSVFDWNQICQFCMVLKKQDHHRWMIAPGSIQNTTMDRLMTNYLGEIRYIHRIRWNSRVIHIVILLCHMMLAFAPSALRLCLSHLCLFSLWSVDLYH